jgi:hypothetical protein
MNSQYSMNCGNLAGIESELRQLCRCHSSTPHQRFADRAETGIRDAIEHFEQHADMMSSHSIRRAAPVDAGARVKIRSPFL